MRATESSRDVNARSEMGIDRGDIRKKAKKVNGIEKKWKATIAGDYEKRGMTKENKEGIRQDNDKKATQEDKKRKDNMTPQEAFRMQQRQYSKIYGQLQNKENDKNRLTEEQQEQENESEK